MATKQNIKQTTFVLKVMADEFKNEGSDEIWHLIKHLKSLGLDVDIEKTFHGSSSDKFLKSLKMEARNGD